MTLLKPLVTTLLLGIAQANASTLVDIDFSKLHTPKENAVTDGTAIWDKSPNQFHGFWGDTDAAAPLVKTPNGTGIDTSEHLGKVHLCTQRRNIPAEWLKSKNAQSAKLSLDGKQSFTLEAVIKWDPSNTNANGIMGQVANAEHPSEIFLREQNGFLHYALKCGDQQIDIFDNSIDVSKAKADGKFHSIALVHDVSTKQIRCYLDGKLIHTKTDKRIGTLGTLHAPERRFLLGAYNYRRDFYFRGTLDRFRIANTALAPAQLLSPLSKVVQKTPRKQKMPRSTLIAIGGLRLDMQQTE